MTRVLLTGGSGFIAAHVLSALRKHGHSVVTTVRSKEKADKTKAGYPNDGPDKLDFAIVEDIGKEGAFDKAVISDPPFEAVIHTASPFHHNITDIQKDMLDPAIVGTTGILKAVKAHAPSVKRVVITSSFASILDPKRMEGYTYSEKDWSPITTEQALSDKTLAYRGSKKLAERAAWDFVEQAKPNFTLSTICPPLVLGPVVHQLASLDSINTSNSAIAGLIEGKMKEKLPPSNVVLWIDVRDAALAHVLAMEKDAAQGQRFFCTAGHFSNKEVTEIIAAEFPEYRDRLPTGERLEPGSLPPPGKRPEYDNSRSKEVLRLTYRPLKETIVETVKSLKAFQKE